MIVGITGYAGVGKDTLADMLVKECGFNKASFAGKLKELYMLIGKESDISHIELLGMETAKRSIPAIREELQRIGMAMRQVFGEDFWIKTSMPKDENNTVFADVRFPNEAQAIKDRGGIIIRLKRDSVKPVNSHYSEFALDLIDADLTIENFGLEATFSEVKEYLCPEMRSQVTWQ